MSLSFAKLFAAALTVMLASGADAADLPQRKSGLWDIKTRQDGGPEMTMQMCIDSRQDDFATQPADDNIRRQCPKMAVSRRGGNIVIDSVCHFDKITATGHTVVSGDLASRYRMESTTRFEPPMHGIAQSHTIMTGQWLGPCKPGQKHGSMTLPGLPGGGQFRLDPEMMKQIEKMQQQYGR